MKILLTCFGLGLLLSSAVSAQVVTPPMDKLAHEKGVNFPLPFELRAPTTLEVAYSHPAVQPATNPYSPLKPLKLAPSVTFQVTGFGNIVPAELQDKVAACDVTTTQIAGDENARSRTFFHATLLTCNDREGKLVAQSDIEGFVAARSDGKNGVPNTELQKGTPAVVILSKEAKLYPASLLIGGK